MRLNFTSQNDFDKFGKKRNEIKCLTSILENVYDLKEIFTLSENMYKFHNPSPNSPIYLEHFWKKILTKILLNWT